MLGAKVGRGEGLECGRDEGRIERSGMGRGSEAIGVVRNNQALVACFKECMVNVE